MKIPLFRIAAKHQNLCKLKLTNGLNFIHRKWGYFLPWEDQEHWGNVEFEHFFNQIYWQNVTDSLKNSPTYYKSQFLCVL